MCIASTEQVALVQFQLRLEPNRTAVIGIFLAIDGCYVGWIFIEIRPPNSTHPICGSHQASGHVRRANRPDT